MNRRRPQRNSSNAHRSMTPRARSSATAMQNASSAFDNPEDIENMEQTMTKHYRIGQIVPSSNTTMETEIPAMLLARQSIRPERFTFHSSRMRMHKVERGGM